MTFCNVDLPRELSSSQQRSAVPDFQSAPMSISTLSVLACGGRKLGCAHFTRGKSPNSWSTLVLKERGEKLCCHVNFNLFPGLSADTALFRGNKRMLQCKTVFPVCSFFKISCLLNHLVRLVWISCDFKHGIIVSC